MAVEPDILIMLAIFTPLGLAVAWWLNRRGVFAGDAFALAPERAVTLTLVDLLIAFLIYVGSGILFFAGLEALGVSPSKLESMSASDYARYAVAQHAVQIPVALYILIRAGMQPRGWRELGLVPRELTRELKIGLLALLAAIPLVMAVNSIVVVIGVLLGFPMPDAGHQMLKRMLESPSPVTTAALLTSAVVLAPLAEELMFRGLVQTSLRSIHKLDRWAVVLGGAFIFMLIHFGMPWQVMPGLLVLGVTMGWVYERTGSLLPGLIVHVGFNALNSAWVLSLQTQSPV